MVSSGWLTEDARVEGRYLNKEACSSAVNRMVRRSLAPDHTSRQRCRIPEGGNPGFGLVDHEMVAGACNHPNLLVLPFRFELIRVAA